MPVIAVIAAGQMGAAVAARLGRHGTKVVTSLAGRGPASIARAQAAEMVDVDDPGIAAADMVLSIVPPAEAEAVANRFAPVLARAPRKPLYVDCNAVSPATALRIAAAIGRAGSGFVDVGIVGPPVAPSARTVFYASGEAAPRFAALAPGLEIRVLPQPVGGASALKMSYAGITKGLTAIGAAMLLAAGKAGVTGALAAELGESQPALAAWLKRAVPGMFGKAGRWTGEMHEIGAFAGGEPAAIYQGMADFFAMIARDAAGGNTHGAALTEIVRRLP